MHINNHNGNTCQLNFSPISWHVLKKTVTIKPPKVLSHQIQLKFNIGNNVEKNFIIIIPKILIPSEFFSKLKSVDNRPFLTFILFFKELFTLS